MVEATAVDCGEGHTFCRGCIERWLAEAEGEPASALGGGRRGRCNKRCPTCQNAVRACIPMRQYDAMIEKYVRASNLWDEITSYYRRKTLARMRRELEQEAAEQAEEEERRRGEAGAGGRASAAFIKAFAGLGLGGLFSGGAGDAASGVRRRNTQRGRAGRAGSSSSAASGNATATEHEGREGREGGGGGREGERWWKSEILHTALSVATMLILVVLFRRGVKVR